MGRRKIEIQPITHERNRSVTFLKRKNGLFKKAYELGVLCSVDVAVIIFEERPGHHVKLYQYCSTDVHNMVQRHLRFDGEKDTRTPVDFSNNKNEEVADDDEDGDEDDGTGLSRQKKDANKAHLQSKPKTDSVHTHGYSHMNGSTNGVPIRPGPTQIDLAPNSIDLDYRNGASRLQNVQTNGGLSVNGSLPLPSDRHNPSSRGLNMGMVNNGMLPVPVPVNLPMPPHKRPRLNPAEDLAQSGITYPYRLDVDLNTYPPTALATSLPQQNGSLSGLYNSNVQNVGMQQNYLSNGGFEFPTTRRSLGFNNGQNFGNGMYGPRPGAQANSQSTDMFVELLSASAERQIQPQTQMPAFDWPVHSQNVVQQTTPEVPANSDPASWLDFLTQNSSQTPTSIALGLPTPTPSSRAGSSSISSANGRPYGLPSASSSTESLHQNPMRRKRSRDEAAASDLEDSELRMSLPMSTKIALGPETSGGSPRRIG